MDAIVKLTQYLQEGKPYPCLHVLEAAWASWNYWIGGEIPEELMQNLRDALGDEAVQTEITRLLALGILEETDTAQVPSVKLTEAGQPAVAELLRQLRCHLELEAGEGPIEAYEYLDQLVQYLQSAGLALCVKEAGKDSFLLELEGATYRLLLTLSPLWLPLMAEKGEDEQRYCLAFGPFASQAWGTMHAYFEVEEFRTQVALYDPWSREKMSVCKGTLPVYIDWFHRDRYQSRFSIPAEFCEALHGMGLLRYNDER